ncbi:MAG: hypothetical protein VCC01_08375 [Candidatus Hydrogenedentota bacterium]
MATATLSLPANALILQSPRYSVRNPHRAIQVLLHHHLYRNVPVKMRESTRPFTDEQILRFTHKKTTVYNDALVKSSYTRSR